MTYEEALDRFIDFAHNQGVTTAIHEEMIATIKEALEKQIPKKPVEYKYIGEILVGAHCPNCGAEILVSGRPCYCGQCIDWSKIK